MLWPLISLSSKLNDEDISIFKILSDFDIAAGIFTSKCAEDCGNAWIKLPARKATEELKRRTKTLRHARKHYIAYKHIYSSESYQNNSASARKIGDEKAAAVTGYLLVDMEILSVVF